MSFTRDLEKGKELEMDVAEYFGGEMIDGYLKEYDLKIECKKDLLHPDTGNVAIELLYKGSPAGWVDGATVLVYEVYGQIRIAKTTKVKERMKLNRKEYRVVNGGDNNDSKIALLSIQKFLSLFTKLV